MISNLLILILDSIPFFDIIFFYNYFYNYWIVNAHVSPGEYIIIFIIYRLCSRWLAFLRCSASSSSHLLSRSTHSSMYKMTFRTLGWEDWDYLNYRILKILHWNKYKEVWPDLPWSSVWVCINKKTLTNVTWSFPGYVGC